MRDMRPSLMVQGKVGLQTMAIIDNMSGDTVIPFLVPDNVCTAKVLDGSINLLMQDVVPAALVCSLYAH